MLLAPNGKPSNLTPEQYKLVRTAAFKAWFGDWENNPKNASKVIDENGEPLVVYHTYEGANSPSVFRKNIETYIDGQHTRVFEGDDDYEKIISSGSGIFSEYWEFWFSNKVFGGGFDIKHIKCFLNIRKLHISENGKGGQGSFGNYKDEYDGVSGAKITNADGQEGVDYYIVLFSNQIKLADGANTTFDSSNPDIRFSGGGTPSKKYTGLMILKYL